MVSVTAADAAPIYSYTVILEQVLHGFARDAAVGTLGVGDIATPKLVLAADSAPLRLASPQTFNADFASAWDLVHSGGTDAEAIWRRPTPADQIATGTAYYMSNDFSGTCASEIINATEGTAVATKVISSGGVDWEKGLILSGSHAAGTWTMCLRITVASGSGVQNKVRALLERTNGSCTVQQTIFDTTFNVDKGSTKTYTINVTGSAVTFSSDYMILTLFDNAGSQAKTLRYDDAAPDNSRLIAPD